MEQIVLTDNAAKRISYLAENNSKNGTMLRIGVKGGGCSGFTYNFEFTNIKQEGDIEIVKNQAIVLIDQVSREFIAGAVIDYVVNLGNEYFEIRNPNATAKCGCGNSFSI